MAIADQAVWLSHFRSKLPGACATLGIPAEQYLPILQDAGYLIYLLQQWLVSVRTFAPAGTAFVEAMQMGSGVMERPIWQEPPLPEGVVPVEAGALRRIFAFVQVLKIHTGCTDVLARDLGLLPRADAAEHPVPVAQFSIERGAESEAVRARLFKYGHQCVVIESRRGGPEAPWEEVGITTASPWFDRRPLLVAGQPEVREYRLRFWDKGAGHGDWTDVSRITVSP